LETFVAMLSTNGSEIFEIFVPERKSSPLSDASAVKEDRPRRASELQDNFRKLGET